MTETVMVTGGTGYVAGWVIVELLRRGYAVRTTVRSRAKGETVRQAVATQVDPGDRLSFAVADLTRDEGWDEAVAGVDYVLHEGALPSVTKSIELPRETNEANVTGTLNMLVAARDAGAALAGIGTLFDFLDRMTRRALDRRPLV